MGGKKKQSLKQMSKKQQKGDIKSKNKKDDSKATFKEKKVKGINPPDLKDEIVLKELKRMKVLTPYIVASHFNIRLGIAKTLLRGLNEKGIITFVSGDKKTKIYKPQ
jgi:small subunit ribosomal protein S25e